MTEFEPYDNAAGEAADETDADVVVVGNGPVGAVLSVLLAQHGWRVTVLERRPQPYRLPRATSFDGETARLLAATGIGPRLGAITEPATGYQWRTAAGAVLLDIGFSGCGTYGWPDANTMHQPALEELISARAAELPSLRMLRGREVVRIADRGPLVEVSASDDDDDVCTVTARWVVGCDGASSFVRDQLDVSVTDLGFSYEWLLCDVELREPREFVPTNVQICDPARPTTLVGSGPGHRRWEFMRLPGESAADLNQAQTAWRLLAPFGVTPDTAVLLRSTTYIFQARWADEWRVGRVLLAGDAAHLMPPFAGQGMCSGVRDVTNLAWKLDLVLRGRAGEALLDSYAEERRPQVRDSILSSVQLGRVICVTDPAAAAERDATVLANRRGGGPVRPEPARPLVDGLLYRRSAGQAAAEPPAGAVIAQGRVSRLGRTGLFDEIVGRGFVLLSTGDPVVEAGADRLAFLAGLGGRAVRLLAPGQEADAGAPDQERERVCTVVDVDDVYRPYLARFGATSLLVRPDCHVFGAATGPQETAALLDDLRQQLGSAGAAHGVDTSAARVPIRR